MESTELIYTLAYILICVGLIVPPSEFQSAGLTVQNMLGGFLGSEEMNYIFYHIRRTCATAIFHSILPLGYYVGLLLFTHASSQWMPWALSLPFKIVLAASVIAPLAVASLVYHWTGDNWTKHPIARTLSHHAPAGRTWRDVASSINVEFRRIDKFTTGTFGRRLVVTDSWVTRCSTYYMHIAHQSDIHLHVTGTDEHELSHESSTGSQYLNIIVHSVNDKVKSFKIRLNAAEYSDLKDKLQAPIVTARNVVIHQSLSDRFLEAFRQHVQQNQPFHKPQDLEIENCIGCMQTPANVKLVKLCDNINDGECRMCYCRPMWCMECMGKWFSSRQDQSLPETWLGSKCPCPTCRAKFCILDVSPIIF